MAAEAAAARSARATPRRVPRRTPGWRRRARRGRATRSTRSSRRAGSSAAQLKEVESYGLLAGRAVGRETYYDDDALGVAQLAAQFMQYGVEARHLRMYRRRRARGGLLRELVMPLLKQRNPRAREQAIETVETLLKLGDSMRATMLRAALRDYSSS